MAGPDQNNLKQNIAATLSQTGPLTWQQVHDLQTNLRDMEHAPGKSDGIIGPITTAAIMNFYNENPDLAANASSQIRSYMSQHGYADELKSLADTDTQSVAEQSAELPSLSQTFSENAAPPAAVESTQIQTILQQNAGLSGAQIRTLQTELNGNGFDVGRVDGDFGPKTAVGIISYLQQNPSMVDQMSPAVMRDLMRNGQEGALVALAQNSEAIQSRIGEMVRTNPDLATTNDHGMVTDLQTLLTVGGHAPGGIDGIVGSQTMGAVDKYMAASGIEIDLVRTEPTRAPVQGSTGDWLGSVSRPVLGDNGYGVANATIERAWSRVTGDPVPAGADYTVASLNNAGRPLVVIDLGHGEDVSRRNLFDDGAISPHSPGFKLTDGLSETEIADALAGPLAQQLHEKGYDVAFTRNPGEQYRVEGPKGGSLATRPEFATTLATEMGASDVIFISLHANSSTNPNANGGQVYLNGGNNTPTSPQSNALADKIAGSFQLTPEQTTDIRTSNFAILRGFERDAPQSVADGVAAFGAEAGINAVPHVAQQSSLNTAFQNAHNNTVQTPQDTNTPERNIVRAPAMEATM